MATKQLKTINFGDGDTYELTPEWSKIENKPSLVTSEEFTTLSTAVDGKQPKGDYALKNEIPSVPVQSINGKTGVVVLSASDVGALPSTTTVPTKTSQLTNDSGFLTQHQDISGKADKATTLAGYGITDGATKTELNNLSNEIVDQRGIIDGKQPIGNYLTEIPEEYVTEEELETELADLKAQGVQQTPLIAQGDTLEECLAWLEANGDRTKTYIMKKEVSDDVYAYLKTKVTTEGSTTPNFTNLFDNATIKEGYRYSQSGREWKPLSGAYGIIVPVPTALVGKSWTLRVKPFDHIGYVYVYGGTSADSFTESMANFPNADTEEVTLTIPAKSCTHITFVVGNITDLIITANEEITYTTTEGGTTVGYQWATTGHKFIPADYEKRIIELERNKASNINTSLGISEVFAPSPQLPADGSATADFNGDRDSITAEQIYAKIDELLNLYPRFITKEVMGKDESGTHDWCRYVCSKRAYDAWQKPNYPPMYAWVNGSTVIYSVSVSPRIGDTLYTTKYVGTSKGTVTAVSNANQTRTVGGVVYTRDSSKDIEPTLVYTETAYSPYFSSNYSSGKNGIYDNTKAKVSTISNMANGTLTGANGVNYTRYPLGDRNSKFETIPSIVIGANEHGTGGDPATPAMISARMIKDLCECVNANNPFLNLLKNEYMVVFCPVVNPWGFHKNNKSYYNSNGVNLDRNFDTIGWGNDTTYPQGDYGGSENETQYFMNTLVASKCKVAMCNHSYGHGIDNTTGEAVSGGICSYMMGRNKTKYTEALFKIAEVMASNYNLVFNDNGEAPPENWAKTRSYFEWIGVDGIALEINSRDGFITDPNNEAEGKQFTARVMEAGYTQLLQALYMLIDKLDS